MYPLEGGMSLNPFPFCSGTPKTPVELGGKAREALMVGEKHPSIFFVEKCDRESVSISPPNSPPTNLRPFCDSPHAMRHCWSCGVSGACRGLNST